MLYSVSSAALRAFVPMRDFATSFRESSSSPAILASTSPRLVQPNALLRFWCRLRLILRAEFVRQENFNVA